MIEHSVPKMGFTCKYKNIVFIKKNLNNILNIYNISYYSLFKGKKSDIKIWNIDFKPFKWIIDFKRWV